jgi:hypothetical protein
MRINVLNIPYAHQVSLVNGEFITGNPLQVFFNSFQRIVKFDFFPPNGVYGVMFGLQTPPQSVIDNIIMQFLNLCKSNRCADLYRLIARLFAGSIGKAVA